MALTLKVLDPRNLRTETTIKGTQRTVANSAGVAVRYENGEREGAVPLWISAFQRQDLLPTVSIAKDLQDDSVSIEYLGTEDYAGRKVHHIRFWSTRLGEIEPDVVEQLSSFHVYIDAETLLVLKTSRRVSAVDTYTNYSILENRYDDYVEQAGVLLPRKIDQFMAGARVSQITVLGVERAELNAADFK
jgi:hypothetical protein